MDNQEKMYGVWIPREGWLRGSDVFADYNKDKARQVARLIGKGARVRYIDNAIAECEKNYLEQEGRTLWHIFRNYFNRNASK